eukprot:346145-Rhodomonas_salina.2
MARACFRRTKISSATCRREAGKGRHTPSTPTITCRTAACCCGRTRITRRERSSSAKCAPSCRRRRGAKRETRAW